MPFVIKTILCDLGDVIVFVDHKKIAKGLAKFSSRDEKHIYNFFLSSMARKGFDKGKITAKGLFAHFKDKLGLSLSLSQFKKIWCYCFTGLNEDMANLLYKLKKNYKLILLSNTDEIHFAYCRKNYKVLDIFDDFILSYKSGCKKPNPLIYFRALKRAKTFPTKAAYIDDIKEFVAVSKFFGIKGIRYATFEKLKKDLMKMDISV